MYITLTTIITGNHHDNYKQKGNDKHYSFDCCQINFPL